MSEDTEKSVNKGSDESKPLVFVPGWADLNFSNHPLPPPQTKYNPAANMRSGDTESWADILRKR